MEVPKPPRDHEAFPDGRCRLILIGKTGCGKSATGNTILGREQFQQQIGINSQTEVCDMGSTKRDGLLISVMDTPGLADTAGRDEIIGRLITQSLVAVHPGPHAVILCIRCDDRFTETEYNVYQALKEIFGEKMTAYLIVIFVGADQLESRGIRFDDMLTGQRAERLKSLLQEADNRYLLFNNHADQLRKAQQVKQLLVLVKKVVVENGGECFRHKVSPEITQTVKQLLEEEMKEAGVVAADREVIGTSQSEVSHSEMQAEEKQQDMKQLAQAGNVKERLKRLEDMQQAERKGPPPTQPKPKPMTPRYTVPDRPGMGMDQKQKMVERVLEKVVRHPEELNAAQQKSLEKASESIGQKIKDGMKKFAVKAMDQCVVM